MKLMKYSLVLPIVLAGLVAGCDQGTRDSQGVGGTDTERQQGSSTEQGTYGSGSSTFDTNQLGTATNLYRSATNLFSTNASGSRMDSTTPGTRDSGTSGSQDDSTSGSQGGTSDSQDSTSGSQQPGTPGGQTTDTNQLNQPTTPQ